MSIFKDLCIDITKIQLANAKALAIHHKFQEGLSENPIYPVDKYDSDAVDCKRESKQLKEDNPIILPNQINPPDWQELQAKDELEQELFADDLEKHEQDVNLFNLNKENQ